MGTLFVVATPIGNLQDITLRAIEIIHTAEFIACEDTRRAKTLLSFIQKLKGLEQRAVPMLLSYYEENERLRLPKLLNILQNDKHVVLISDAGTPAISDPGFKLIRACRENGIPVEVIPGPSSVITALVSSGLPTDKFLFLGYLPAKQGKRTRFLTELKEQYEAASFVRPTIIFFEAPHRIVKMLGELQEMFGDIPIAVCREMTKIHEEVRREKISQVITHFQKTKPKGEFVVLFKLEGGEE